MKNVLPIVLFLILFLINDTVVDLGLLPSAVVWSLEVFIAVIAIVVIARIVVRKSFHLPLKYIFLFCGFLYVVIAGIVLNEVSALTTVAGIRTYFKYVPIFLLPLAYDYSIDDLKKQFVFLIFLGLIQIPVALYQRIELFKYTPTGDIVSGTLSNSNSVSIVLLAMIMMLFALYFRKIVTLKVFVLLSILLFIPATLNETKVTPLLLIIGIAGILFVVRKQLTMKQVVTAIASGIIFLGMFTTLYSVLYGGDTGVTYADSISKERLIDNYAYKGYKADAEIIFRKQTNIVGEEMELPDRRMGRIDSVLIPLDVLVHSNDLGKLFFGLGIGNVNSSRADAHYTYINKLGGASTTLALLLWETGIAGAIIFIIIMILIARDSFKLAKSDDSWGAISIGWFGVVLIMIATLGYNTMFHLQELACLFMYFSSIVIVRQHFTLKSEV